MESVENMENRKPVDRRVRRAPRTVYDVPARVNSRRTPKKTTLKRKREDSDWEKGETEFLLEKVDEIGTGKWKAILIAGQSVFKTSRTSVQLKEKYLKLREVHNPVAIVPDKVEVNPDPVRFTIDCYLHTLKYSYEMKGSDTVLILKQLVAKDACKDPKHKVRLFTREGLVYMLEDSDAIASFAHECTQLSVFSY